MHRLDNYPKPLRFNVDGRVALKYKKYLTAEEMTRLLSGKVVVEEKMDGKSSRFETQRFVLFAEDMQQGQRISYRVPARFALFDVFDKKRGMLLGVEGKRDVYWEIKNYPGFLKDCVSSEFNTNIDASSFFLVNVLEMGKFEPKDLPDLMLYSAYGKETKTRLEGIVVKTIRDVFDFELRAGQLVLTEYIMGSAWDPKYFKEKGAENVIDPIIAEVNHPFVRMRGKPTLPNEIRGMDIPKN